MGRGALFYMDTMNEFEETLQHHGVKPTAVRMLVWRCVSGRTGTFSLSDVEQWLPDMDRSSIFRALRLFTENKLLHEIDDGTGSCKYCVCHCEHTGHINHVHFSCTKCGKTYCISEQTIPLVQLPEGFVPSDIEYVIKGLCPKCS